MEDTGVYGARSLRMRAWDTSVRFSFGAQTWRETTCVCLCHLLLVLVFLCHFFRYVISENDLILFFFDRKSCFKMFEAKLVNGSLLKKIIDAIKDIVTEANFECSSTGNASLNFFNVFILLPFFSSLFSLSSSLSFQV